MLTEISFSGGNGRREGSLDLNRRRIKAGPILRKETQDGDANGER